MDFGPINDVRLVGHATARAELPSRDDYPILFRMRAMGLEPGRAWDADKLNAKTSSLINDAAQAATGDIIGFLKRGGEGTHINGWNIATDNMETYGTSYLLRAVVNADSSLDLVLQHESPGRGQGVQLVTVAGVGSDPADVASIFAARVRDGWDLGTAADQARAVTHSERT